MQKKNIIQKTFKIVLCKTKDGTVNITSIVKRMQTLKSLNLLRGRKKKHLKFPT